MILCSVMNCIKIYLDNCQLQTYQVTERVMGIRNTHFSPSYINFPPSTSSPALPSSFPLYPYPTLPSFLLSIQKSRLSSHLLQLLHHVALSWAEVNVTKHNVLQFNNALPRWGCDGDRDITGFPGIQGDSPLGTPTWSLTNHCSISRETEVYS